MPQHLERIVRNRSSRGGVKPDLIVLHTTESHPRPGVADLTSLADWFNNPGSQASSHQGVDAEGNTIKMVPGGEKAWTQASFNPRCLSIEQVGWARTSRTDWYRGYMAGLKATAHIVASWSQQFGIPLRRGRIVAGRVLLKGVVEHSNLGAAGGGHHDCGPGYPTSFVIWAAKYYAAKDKHDDKTAKKYRDACNREARKYGATFG